VLGALVSAGVTVAMATASFYLIERPFLRVRDRITARSSSARGELVGASPAS
jgi:peptidoglycan/LPS O-acetylase OafA/YrhL